MDKQRPAKRKRRERTLRHATLLGLTGTIGVAIALYIVLYFLPPSDLHNYYEVITTPNSGIMPNSQLLGKFQSSIDHQDWFVSPVSLFIGGLILGKLAPRIAGKRRVTITAAKMGFLTLLVGVAFPWIETLVIEHKNGLTVAGRIDGILVAGQILLNLLCTLACAVGGFAGAAWRDRVFRPSTDAPRTAPVAAAKR